MWNLAIFAESKRSINIFKNTLGYNLKVRLGFVSNSSSSSFLCTDKSFTVAKLKQKLIEAKEKNENVIDVKNFVFNVIDDDYICKNFGLFSFFSKHEEEILGTKKEARHQKILELTKLKEYKDTLDGLIHIFNCLLSHKYILYHYEVFVKCQFLKCFHLI